MIWTTEGDTNNLLGVDPHRMRQTVSYAYSKSSEVAHAISSLYYCGWAYRQGVNQNKVICSECGLLTSDLGVYCTNCNVEFKV